MSPSTFITIEIELKASLLIQYLRNNSSSGHSISERKYFLFLFEAFIGAARSKKKMFFFDFIFTSRQTSSTGEEEKKQNFRSNDSRAGRKDNLNLTQFFSKMKSCFAVTEENEELRGGVLGLKVLLSDTDFSVLGIPRFNFAERGFLGKLLSSFSLEQFEL